MKFLSESHIFRTCDRAQGGKNVGVDATLLMARMSNRRTPWALVKS